MERRPTDAAARRRRKTRIALWSLAGILAVSFALPLGSYLAHELGIGGGAAHAQEAGAELGANPRSNYWRAVNEGVAGYSAVNGPGANILIERGGTPWQELRNGPITEILPWAIVAMAVILLLYHLVFGRNKLEDKPLSGRRLHRWGWFDRLTHWVTAISFIALAITGLSMLIGRAVLIPVLGKAGFAMWAQASITIHNVVGPVFCVGIALMIVMWIWHNFPQKGDWTWLKEGGGMFSKHKHPPAGRMNAGEKLWFWLVASVGVLVCLTGIVLVAPIYGLTLPGIEALRPEMRGASIIHAALAILWSAVALGHIYIGTAGTEGAFEGMATGYVTEEWAKQHHNLWYADMAEKGKVLPPERNRPAGTGQATVGGPGGSRPATSG